MCARSRHSLCARSKCLRSVCVHGARNEAKNVQSKNDGVCH